ncbi:MAG: hypothetical protein QXL86_03005 [Candidatus Aenigmatarchaeota archaeon]
MEARIVFVAIVFAIVISLFLAYIFSKPKIDINSELAKLNPDESIVKVINSSECKSLEKSENEWVIKDCKNGIYFRIFIDEKGYLLTYCTSWSTPREAFLKLRNFFSINNCLNESSEDKLLRESGIAKTYEVCGLKIFFMKECIAGVKK